MIYVVTYKDTSRIIDTAGYQALEVDGPEQQNLARRSYSDKYCGRNGAPYGQMDVRLATDAEAAEYRASSRVHPRDDSFFARRSHGFDD